MFRKSRGVEAVVPSYIITKRIQFLIDLERRAAILIERVGETIERENEAARAIEKRLRSGLVRHDEF